MVKNVIVVIVVVAIAATVAYEMGWLSDKGENTYDDVKDVVKESIN